jgi:solute carrier family 23 (nucleobase transporter), member 1
MREIQGSLIIASCFEVLFGLTGCVGLLLKFIGPLTVAPIITLIGISLFPVAAEFCAFNWWIALL